MKKHDYQFSVPAASEKEADQKILALAILATHLTGDELQKLAQVVEHDPIKTALAKSYLGL